MPQSQSPAARECGAPTIATAWSGLSDERIAEFGLESARSSGALLGEQFVCGAQAHLPARWSAGRARAQSGGSGRAGCRGCAARGRACHKVRCGWDRWDHKFRPPAGPGAGQMQRSGVPGDAQRDAARERNQLRKRCAERTVAAPVATMGAASDSSPGPAFTRTRIPRSARPARQRRSARAASASRPSPLRD